MPKSNYSQEVVIDIWDDPLPEVEDATPPPAQTPMPQKPPLERASPVTQPVQMGIVQQEIAELKHGLEETREEVARAAKIVREERALREHAEYTAHKTIEQLAASDEAVKERDTKVASLQQQLSTLRDELEQLTRRAEISARCECEAMELAEQERARAKAISKEGDILRNDLDRSERQLAEAHRELRVAKDLLSKHSTPPSDKPAVPPTQSPWGGQPPLLPRATIPPQRKPSGSSLPSGSIFLSDNPAQPAQDDPALSPTPPPTARPPKRPLIGPAFGGDAPAESDRA